MLAAAKVMPVTLMNRRRSVVMNDSSDEFSVIISNYSRLGVSAACIRAAQSPTSEESRGSPTWVQAAVALSHCKSPGLGPPQAARKAAEIMAAILFILMRGLS